MPEYMETPQDYHIKYGNCYASTEGLDEKFASVVQIQDQFEQADNGSITKAQVAKFYRTPKNQTRSEIGFISMDKINLTPLRLGAVNLNKSCIVLMSLKPGGSTKYRKLPCEGNFQMVDPFKKEREYLDLRSPQKIQDFFILDAWGDRKFFSAPDALNLVAQHKRLGAAFNPTYFFGISFAGDGIFLYKGVNRVARVNSSNEVVLKPPVHRLAEQLSEYGLNVKKVTK